VVEVVVKSSGSNRRRASDYVIDILTISHFVPKTFRFKPTDWRDAEMFDSQPTLYLLCGKIAAGKSTVANRLAAQPATVLISEDHWNSNLFPGELKTIEDYSRYSSRLRNAMGPHVVSLLKAGMSVVLDFPANTLRNRSWMRAIFEDANAANELHFLDVSDETCKRRLRERNAAGKHPFQVSESEYEIFTSYFVPPTPEEGFNVVVHRE
jgi:predicted kinase